MITHNAKSFHGQLQAETIRVGLRIVFDKDNFTEATAKDMIKDQIKDLDDVYGKIKIHFEVEYQPGTAKDFTMSGGKKYYTKIEEGAKDGIINGYLYRDEKEISSFNYTNTGSRQFFLRAPNKGWTDPFNTGGVSHELAHVFGINGSLSGPTFRVMSSVPVDLVRDTINYVANSIDNITSDANIDSAILWMRNGLAVYGRDWVDDYRNSIQLRSARAEEIYGNHAYKPRTPTILDLYRVAAKDIVAQTKK